MQRDHTAALMATDIKKSFGELEVLKGISLTAHKSDVVSIIGASGSGKSTFLRCLNLLDPPDSGQITVGGEQLKIVRGRADARQATAIRARLGMVFQGFNLWTHMSVLENVSEGPKIVLKRDPKDVREQAMSLLEKVGIADKHNAYPSQLSGGQQQRVAIARALCMDPQVLLFDEPTSALDPELVGEVLKVMRDLAGEGRTMIVVTHEMGFAREVSSQVMFLYKGLVEEYGPPDQIFNNATSENCRQFLQSVL